MFGDITDEQEAQSTFSEGQAYMQSKLQTAQAWINAAAQAAQQIQRDGFSVALKSGMLNSTGHAADDLDALLAKAIEMRDQGLIDQAQTDAVFSSRAPLYNQIGNISLSVEQAQVASGLSGLASIFSSMPGLISALNTSIANLKNIWKAVEQAAGQIAESAAAAAKSSGDILATIVKYLPWGLAAFAAMWLLPKVLPAAKRAVASVRGNPSGKKGKRGKFAALLPLLLAGGGVAAWIYKKNKAEVLIPTVSALARINVGSINVDQMAAVQLALDTAGIGYDLVPQQFSNTISVFVDSPKQSAAKYILADLSTLTAVGT